MPPLFKNLNLVEQKKSFSSSENGFLSINNALWLFPSDLSLFQERDKIFKNSNFKTLLFPNLKTFSGLEALLISELNLKKISDYENKFILNTLALQLAEKLNLKKLNSNLQIYELAEILGDGLDRLKLIKVKEKHFLSEINFLYESYLKELNKYNIFSLRAILLEKLKKGKKFKALKNIESINCSTMHRFSPFEEKFLIALAQQYKVNLLLNMPAWVREENIEHASGFNRLRSILEFEKKAETKLNLEFKVNFEVNSPLEYTYENLLKAEKKNPPKIKLNNKIAINKVASQYNEVEEAVKKIKKLILNGCKPEHLALVVPNILNYEDILLNISQRYGVPFYFRRGVNLYSQKLIASIFELLNLADSNWERTRVLRFLNLPYFNYSNLKNLNKQKFADLTLKLGITDDRDGGGFLENLQKAENFQGKEEFLEFYNFLKFNLTNLKDCKTWPIFFKIFENILKTLNWPSNLKVLLQTYKFEIRVLNEFKAFYKTFKTEFLNSTWVVTCNLENFILWFSKGLAKHYFKFDTNYKERVLALNYYDLHGSTFQEVFLLGLNEKVFPSAELKNQIWPEDFLNEVKKLNSGRSLWSGAAEKYREDEELFEAAIGSASEKVNLFYCAYNADNNPTKASLVVEKVKSLWLNNIEEENLISPALPLKEDIYALDEFLNYYTSNFNIKKDIFFNEFESIKEVREKIFFLEEKNNLNLKQDLVNSYFLSLEQFNNAAVFSVSAFIDYFKCPYNFYLKHILKLKDYTTEMEEWSKIAEGNILHKTLKIFFDDFIEKPLTASFNETEKLLNIFEENLKEETLLVPIGRKNFLEARTSDFRKNLKNWFLNLKNTSPDNFKIKANECDFKNLKIKCLSGDKFYLKGRIDRLDFNGQNYKVLDYKLKYNKKYKFNIKNIDFDIYPLLIYILAVEENFKKRCLARLEFISHKPQETSFLELDFLPDDFLTCNLELRLKKHEIKEFDFVNNLALAYENLKNGILKAELFGKPNCTYCDFKLFCMHYKE